MINTRNTDIDMTDEYNGEERRSVDHTRRSIDLNNRSWQSARTILDALILAGIIAMITAQFVSHDQIAKNATDTSVQFATIIAQVASLQSNMADVPALRDRVTALETKQADLTRRQNTDEAVRDRQNRAKK